MKEEKFDIPPNCEYVIEKEFDKQIDHVIETEKAAAWSSILSGDYKFIFELYGEIYKDRTDAFIGAHYIYDFCIDSVVDCLFDTVENNLIDKSDMLKLKILENIRNIWEKSLAGIDKEFTNRVNKLDPNNIPIKEFPKNTTDKEKELLNYLAKNYHIRRELSENGKFPLSIKTGTKRMIKALYEYAPDYQDFHVFNFIHSFIEINLPDTTLQNYCREVKKDMPLKNV